MTDVNKKKERMFLIGVAVLVFLILFWPIKYPAFDNNELPDPVGSVLVTRDKPTSSISFVFSRDIAGVMFWTVEEPKVFKDTIVTLSIIDVISGEHVVTKSEKFSNIFHKEGRRIRFTFPKIRNSNHHEYLVALSMPNAPADQSLAIRGQLQNSNDKTSVQIAVEPIEKRSLLSILYTKIYRAKTDGEDIYYYWLRGGTVANGSNPYICALDDTCINHKNPGHFPLFYILSAISQKAGLTDFEDWIAFWRPIFLLCYVATGFLLFWTLYKRKQYELAVFALFFWLFNRWSMYVIRVAHVDFMAILFLTLSLVLFEKKRYWSVLLFGISLALKQVAIFLLPLYIILIWVRTEKRKRGTSVLISVAAMAFVPLCSILPFVVDNPRSVLTGLLFSATRSSEANIGAAPLVSLLEIHGAQGIIPMAFLMVLVYAAAYRKQLPLSIAGLMILLLFIGFNTVLFNQYFLWFVPFLSLAASEFKKVRLQ